MNRQQQSRAVGVGKPPASDAVGVCCWAAWLPDTNLLSQARFRTEGRGLFLLTFSSQRMVRREIFFNLFPSNNGRYILLLIEVLALRFWHLRRIA